MYCPEEISYMWGTGPRVYGFKVWGLTLRVLGIGGCIMKADAR